MIDRKLFVLPRVLLPLIGIAGSYLTSLIAPALYHRYPSYETLACGEVHASGCYEWGLITVGPFYLLGLVLVFTGLFLLVAAPVATAIGLWLSGTTKRQKTLSPETSTPDAQA